MNLGSYLPVMLAHAAAFKRRWRDQQQPLTENGSWTLSFGKLRILPGRQKSDMMKFLFFLFLFFIFVSPAAAHILKTDGSIGAVIHVTPDDDPIVGEPADFFFEIKDKDKKFRPEACDCRVTIAKNGSEIFSRSLFETTNQANLNTPVFQYTFPERALYTISLAGQPKVANAFQPFAIQYDIRAERVSDTASAAPSAQAGETKSNHWVHYIAIAFIALVFFVLLFIDRLRARARRTPRNNRTTFRSMLILFAVSIILSHAVAANALVITHRAEGHDVSQHSCCMPQALDAPESVVVEPYSPTMRAGVAHEGAIDVISLVWSFSPRSPPFSA